MLEKKKKEDDLIFLRLTVDLKLEEISSFFMNTLIVSTFECVFEDFDKFVADFHEEEGHKYVEEYELIKVNEHKSHLILKVKDLEGFAAATSTPEMKKWDKENGYKDICYSLTPVE